MENKINTAKLRAKRVENGYSMENLAKQILNSPLIKKIHECLLRECTRA